MGRRFVFLNVEELFNRGVICADLLIFFFYKNGLWQINHSEAMLGVRVPTKKHLYFE